MGFEPTIYGHACQCFPKYNVAQEEKKRSLEVFSSKFNIKKLEIIKFP